MFCRNSLSSAAYRVVLLTVIFFCEAFAGFFVQQWAGFCPCVALCSPFTIDFVQTAP